jgi:hypothetical protein
MDLLRMTLPNMMCLLSRRGVAVVVMENCEPLVFAPVFACAQSDKTIEQDDMGCEGCGTPWKEGGSRMLDREGFILKLFTIDGCHGSYLICAHHTR